MTNTARNNLEALNAAIAQLDRDREARVADRLGLIRGLVADPKSTIGLRDVDAAITAIDADVRALTDALDDARARAAEEDHIERLAKSAAMRKRCVERAIKLAEHEGQAVDDAIAKLLQALRDLYAAAKPIEDDARAALHELLPQREPYGLPDVAFQLILPRARASGPVAEQAMGTAIKRIVRATSGNLGNYVALNDMSAPEMSMRDALRSNAQLIASRLDEPLP